MPIKRGDGLNIPRPCLIEETISASTEAIQYETNVGKKLYTKNMFVLTMKPLFIYIFHRLRGIGQSVLENEHDLLPLFTFLFQLHLIIKRNLYCWVLRVCLRKIIGNSIRVSDEF